MLLSVLRLTPSLCWLSGVVSTVGYFAAAYIAGWRLSPGVDGFTVTQTAGAVLRLCFSSWARWLLEWHRRSALMLSPPFARPKHKTGENNVQPNCSLPARC